MRSRSAGIHACALTGRDAGEPHAGCVRSEDIHPQTPHTGVQTARVWRSISHFTDRIIHIRL
jgi:hypothetical protein